MPDPPPLVKNTIGSSRHPMTTPRARFQGNQLSEFPPILAQKLIARIPFGGLLVKCAGQVWGGGRPPRATPKHSATPISAWDWSLLAGTKLADGPPPKHTQGTLNPSPLKGGATTAPFRGFRDSHAHPTWTPPQPKSNLAKPTTHPRVRPARVAAGWTPAICCRTAPTPKSPNSPCTTESSCFTTTAATHRGRLWHDTECPNFPLGRTQICVRFDAIVV